MNDKQQLISSAQQHYSKSDVAVLKSAIRYAELMHKDQKRLSGEDYIVHPLCVGLILIEWKMDIATVVAGVLHDTLEDTEAQLKDLEEKFGKEIAFLVDGVTKVSKARSGMKDISTYLPQTSSNLSKLLIAVCSDLRVILIKLADRLHNLRTLEHLSPEKQKKIAQESLEVFAPLADRLGIGRVRVEIEEISFKYLKPTLYKDLSRQLKKRIGSSNRYIEKVRRDLLRALNAQSIEFELDGRVKSVYSLHKKLKKVEFIDDIYDLLALRIIVDNKEDCYKVLGIIHGLYQPMLTKIKDYISVPKPNGYQSLHTTVITPYEQIFEFQIRSKEMHSFAERGLAASFHYNEQKLTKNYKLNRSAMLPRNLQWITELQSRVDDLVDNGSLDDSKDLAINLFSNRIFAYSPNGDIYDLPEGSTALDFAYHVHSEVGGHAQGAKINNKMSKLSSKLQNGDIVEVITAKNMHPTKGWLEHVYSPRARQKIKNFLRKNQT